MKTRVAKIVGERRIEIFEEEIPALQDNQILVQLKAVGICGSDLHFFRHCGLGSFKSPLPIDIGHEPSGIVVDSKSLDFKAGDEVAIEPGLHCGQCRFCHKGLFNLCSKTKFLGANDIGAFRDYIILEPERLFHTFKMSHNKAALLEPLAVALHAVNRVHCELGDNIAIVGCGSIGLCIMAVLSKMGCHTTICDQHQYRLHAAKRLNPSAFTFVNNEEVVLNKSMTTANLISGSTVVFDAAGTQDSINKATQLVDIGGEICIVGIPEVDELSINPHKLRVKEVTLTNSRRSNQRLEQAYKLFEADETIENIITHQLPLEQIQKGFEIAADYLDGSIKVMIV